MIDEGDLLALQLVVAAFLHRNVVHQRIRLRPIGAQDREHPGEHAAVSGVGTAIAHRDDRDLVGRCTLDQRVGDAGGERTERRRAGRALVLQALVAFDAAVRGIAGLALLGE